MTVIHIDDPADPLLSDYLSLTDMDLRRAVEAERGLFMAEGFLIIHRALTHGLTPKSVLCLPKFADRVVEVLGIQAPRVPVLTGEADLLREVTGYHVHRGALAVLHRPVEPTLADLLVGAHDLLILEDLVDPTNVGLAIRSAAAFGCTGMLVSPGCADPLYRRSVKSSMGAVLTMPWRRARDFAYELNAVRDAGFNLLALTPNPSAPELHETLDPVKPVAMMVGTEGEGLSGQAMDLATSRARIDMAEGIDSLNVAASVAVAAYAVQRHRRSRPASKNP